MNLKSLISSFLVATLTFGYAQKDYHFKIGERELSGIDIYGINEDSDKTLWITSDNGLYSFDGYKFKNYSSLVQVSNSLFSPTFDYNGVLHCHNLSGQIFKVVNDSLILAHQVPDSLLGPYTNFEFLPNNDMIISSKMIYRLSEDNISIIAEKNVTQSLPSRLEDGSIIATIDRNSAVLVFNDSFRFLDLPYKLRNKSYFFQKDEKLYEINYLEGIYLVDSTDGTFLGELLVTVEPQSNIYTTSERFWITKATTGVQSVRYEEMTPSEVLFKDDFISYVFEDSEGNTLLGTFKKGIIVIPRSSMQTLRVPKDEQVSEVTRGPDNSIFFGTYNGKVYGWDGEDFQYFNYQYLKQIERLEYFPEDEVLLIEPFSVYDIKTKKLLSNFQGSIKDYARLDERQYFVGTSNELILTEITEDAVIATNKYPTGRTSAVVHNPLTGVIVVNTISGLKSISIDGLQKKIQLDGKTFVVNDLANFQEDILIATQNFGILKYSGDSLQNFITTTKNDLRDADVKQIEICNDTIYLSQGDQLQVFNKELESIAVFGKSDGINFKILDFTIGPDFIWISSDGELHRLSKSIFTDQKTNGAGDLLQIQRVAVLLNGVPKESGQELELSEEEISFEIHAPSLSKSADLTYKYKLNDEAWNQSSFSQNVVSYQSLAFGNYKFTVKLLFKGEEIDSQTISFKVKAPFYYQYWFSIGVVSLIVLILQLLYRKRLREKTAQSKLQSELNLSKLTALQSQMNPHFVFNALNSIQEYIITNEKKLAAMYLGKFADLMRIYLTHSQQQVITVEDDFYALKLYLELEKVRFENTLDYDITISDQVDKNFEIPSFLIQPYVENAIKHGLFHRKKDRRLSIQINMEKDNSIVYTIEDNGIGREASQQINKSRVGHKSFATEAIRSRIELINHDRKAPILEEIVDLKDEIGTPIGTRVILKVPVL